MCKSLGKEEFEGQGIQDVDFTVSSAQEVSTGPFASNILNPCFISYDTYLSSANSLLGGQSYEYL